MFLLLLMNNSSEFSLGQLYGKIRVSCSLLQEVGIIRKSQVPSDFYA